MARRSVAAAEVAEENIVNVPFGYKIPVPAGTTVAVHYSLDGGKSWQTDNLAPSGGGFSREIEMEEGTKYKYLFKIQVPGQSDKWDPPGGIGTYKEGIAKAKEIKSPSPTHSYADVSSSLKTRVSGILESARDSDAAQNLKAMFQDFEQEVTDMGIKENITPMILQAAVEVIREMEGLPKAVTQLFPEKSNPVEDFNDFESRLKKGSAAYRRKVFEQLRNDPVARKKFGLEGAGATYNPLNPLGEASLYRLFDRLCSERDLGHLSTDIGVALAHMSPEPARSSAAQAKLTALATRVGARLTPEKRSLLSKMPAGRLGKTIDTAFQVGLIASEGIWSGGLLSVAKSGIEVGTGVGVKDLVSALKKDPYGKRNWKMLWEMMRENSAVSRLWNAKEGEGGKEFKSILKEAALRAIPGSSFWYKRKAAEAVPEVEEGTKAKEKTSAEAMSESMVASPEELISKAIAKALTL